MLQIAATNIFAIKTFVFLTQNEVLCKYLTPDLNLFFCQNSHPTPTSGQFGLPGASKQINPRWGCVTTSMIKVDHTNVIKFRL